jgi:type II secretory pathway component PulF
MTTVPHTFRSFVYQAQGDDGRRVTGTIDASDAGTAILQLETLQLRVIEIEPLKATVGGADVPRPRTRALHGDDFAAFNQQLAHLTAAGLPVEAGLRLIAQDMRSGRLAATVALVADELERGVPLGEAFDRHRGKFPALYGRLLDAGVKSGDLSGVLLNLGRHMEMVQRLRSLLWRALSYPLVVLVALAVVLTFLGLYVLPQFEQLYAGFMGDARALGVMRSRWYGTPPPSSSMPWPTEVLFAVSKVVPQVGSAVLVLLLAVPVVWALLRLKGWDVHVVDRVALGLPLVGRALRLNLVARWCHALRIGVAAGLDLPAAIALAGDAVRSPRLRGDGERLIRQLEAGQPMTAAARELSLLPATVPAAIELAAGHHNLPDTLGSLSEMYERQAELRTSAVPAILTPLLVIGVACTVGFIILALMLPMARIIENIGRM